MTLESINDMTINRHVLKFLARNGPEVWQRLQIVPQLNISSKDDSNVTEEPVIYDTSESALIEDSETTTLVSRYLKSRTNQLRHKYRADQNKKKRKKKVPDSGLQIIETENGFIRHDVRHPKRSKNRNKVFRNKSMKQNNDNNDRETKTTDESWKSLSAKPKYKKNSDKVKRKSLNKKTKSNNRIGNIVIKGFNGLFDGLWTLFG